ncbi:MAG: hypothetical protein ACPGYV_15430, partial [Phycisphaeraceae bacterium]
TADPTQWGALSDEAMQAGVEAIRAFCIRVQREMRIDLQLYESERFVLLTDIEAEGVAALAPKLAKAYRAIAETLGDDPDGNIFLGKCLVVLFDQRVDYIRFQQQMHDTDARGTGGLCHGFGDGHVRVAAYQRANPRQTNHILAHELVHAYLHRYHAPTPLPDWVDEGLAEHLAHAIEPPPGQNLYLKTRLLLEDKQGLGDGFFDGKRLASWQYDVAGALTGYLIERSDRVYPKWIRSIKTGTPAEQALEAHYRMDTPTLVQRFKRRLDRALNKQLGG